MNWFKWFSKSITRQISVLLIFILSVSSVSLVLYFYKLQSDEIKQSTSQMASQLLSSLTSTNAKHIHFNNHYNSWLEIKSQIKNNKKQIKNGGLFKISEIAILDLNGNTISHNDPLKYPLQKKYTGILIVKPQLVSELNNILYSWIKTDTVDALRLYDKVVYQGRVEGMIILQLDLSLSKEYQNKLISNFIVYLSVVVLIASLIGILFGRWVSSPINLIETSLKHMGSGKLNLIDLHKRKDEYYYLAKSIENIDSDLYNSQTRINLLLDSTAEAIYGIDNDGICTFSNKSCRNMLGYDSDSELLGKNMHSLIHQSLEDGTTSPENKSSIFSAFQNNTNIHVDNEVVWRKDGSCFPVEYWSHHIFEDTICIGAVVTFLDITKRIESERAVRENEKNLKITLNSIGDAVITTDPKGNVTRMNPAAIQLTGWTLDHARGRSLKDIFSIVNATTREPIENPVDKVLQTGKTLYLSNHTTLLSKNGSEFQIADSAAPIRDKDEILGVVLVFNDITKEYTLREVARKSIRDLQAIMDHSPTVIYVKDKQGCYIFINKQYELLFHIKRKNIIGKKDNEIFPKELAEKLQHNDETVLSEGIALEFEEVFSQNEKNNLFSSIKFPLRNEDDEVYAVCGISTDITIRRNQDELLRRTQKMDALGKLTGGIAHDYNNILGIILGYAEQIQTNAHDHNIVIKSSDSIKRAAERGAKLAKKLLLFSKQKTPNLHTVDLNKLLREQLHLLEKTLTAGIKLSLRLEENLWSVEIDGDEFEDVIINLSINAAHAMQSVGQLTISTSNEHLNKIDAQPLDLEEGSYVLLSITDTGCGMDVKTKERIFDPFYSTKGESGTGLGLSQVYGFIQRSNGAIKVYSEVDMGSRFVLYLPRSEQSLDEIELNKEEILENVTGTEKVLVVDDEPDMVNIASNLLTAKGYTVLVAYDGNQALKILDNNEIDLIVSDVIMPNMNGYQLASTVRKKYPNIKIQLVSGFADQRHKTMVNKSLNDNMLFKPYSSTVFLSRIRKLLDAPSTPNIPTILILDDDEDIQELHKLNFEKLNYKVICVFDCQETIEIYKNSLTTNTPIDIVIVDLTIPGSIGGLEVSKQIRVLDPHAKILVASGNSMGPEMMNPQKYGFNGALEKNFNIDNMKRVLQEVLNS